MDDEDEPLREIRVKVCQGCLDGAEGHCDTLGCAFILRPRPSNPQRRIIGDLVDVTASL